MGFSKWQSVALTRQAGHLEAGPSHRFGDWPCADLPAVASGVYTVWDGDRLLYLGQAGAHWSEADSRRYRSAATPRGLFPQLQSHRTGNCHTDAFRSAVCERLIRPFLSLRDTEEIEVGMTSLNVLVGAYVIERCSFRFHLTDEARQIRRLTALVLGGHLDAGKPLLENPAL